jgi:hypothetical protein
VARFTVDAMVDKTLAAYAGEVVSAAAVAAKRGPDEAFDVAAEELEECEAVTS